MIAVRQNKEVSNSEVRPASPQASAPRRGVLGWIGESLLTIASIGGVLCILLVIAAVVFKVSIMMFATGSMTPTIPAGSIAVVREIPAAEAKVGDVTTIMREKLLPITHRITSITPSDTPGNMLITMRGDANPSDDPEPYDVATVRKVIFSAPGVAQTIVAVSNPWVMGSITIAMATLVTWAFWPRKGSQRRAQRRAARYARKHGSAPELIEADGPAAIEELFQASEIAESPQHRSALGTHEQAPPG